MNKSKLIVIVLTGVVLTGVSAGWFFRHYASSSPMADNASKQTKSESKILYWYDPMVPTQHFDKSGKSPFMDMQLIPKYTDNGEASSDNNSVTIREGVAQNLGIRVVKVQTSVFADGISAVGRIEADEHHLYAIQTRSAGFVEHLSVRAVGDTVKAGQKVADIYAPELLAAQQEYLALLNVTGISDVDSLRQAARQRLQLLGMAEGEIAAITKAGRANPRIGIYAPASGVVTELLVREGGQIVPATNLMQLADLSTVWLILEIPERDASRLKVGDAVESQLESLPEQTFSGRIDYLYPTLDSSTRSVRVRVVMANRSGLLRTGMFVTANVAGHRRQVISVPSEAVISTGTRTVVIVKDGQHFRPVVVSLGVEKNGQSEILKGLQLGEEVVASGQFLIDSEASLNGVLARLTTANNANEIPNQPTAMRESVKADTGIRAKVVAIDTNTSSVTLDHDAIAALNWPPMTMTFKLRHREQLKNLNVGDEVRMEVNIKPEQDVYIIEQLHKEVMP
ncbi:MAG: efflux RND transporter periplasmic adaptor subunit [Agitococcus sp.]|nr:efflux RND transporter periplasmic adaptor subunit [Agitococcus sp.]